ncbi:TIGR04282 family arsenosugar biosynthesis glycosyltransferase [Eudoraea chungangensis]|uniref:TIGR04282 family arsenosugar biosynthesis glycosyltransferase n=1 Tax=Eudoraea chungangensis TaxID=1481905 RepID=UPI0023EB3E81|nr:TIGR04282 family arsenosugar biosynthesis glycosyltransferase [Eudoraea chungangensis]
MNKKDLLLIFTRNPELGKCKTRLAASIGDKNALEVYLQLLEHTKNITQGLVCTKEVYFSEDIEKDTLWDKETFSKKLQKGEDLGEKMYNAFKLGFENGFENIVVIGSDIYDLDSDTLKKAFAQLEYHEYVLGPAQDGGYYLLGMKQLNPSLFKNKTWGTSSVLAETLKDIGEKSVLLLSERNDIDVYNDLKGIDLFESYLKPDL